jgi:uncharacterized protein
MKIMKYLNIKKFKIIKKFAVYMLLSVIAVFSKPAYSQTFYASLPNPKTTDNSWVLDQANILGNYKNEIDSLINEYEKRTSVEIAVVILPTIGERVPKEAATEIFNLWGIGKKGKDNGVLVLHVLDQRRIEIEVGYGLEGDLTDVKTTWILDEITIPFFKEDRIALGHLATVKGIIGVITNPTIPLEEVAGLAEINVQSAIEQGIPADAVPEITPLDESGYSDAPVIWSQRIGGITLLSGLSLFAFWLILYFGYRIIGRPTPYNRYKFYQNVGAIFQYVSSPIIFLSPTVWEVIQYETFFSGIPLIVVAFVLPMWYRSRKLEQFRRLPRTCSECGVTIPEKLGETVDDEFLDAGQRTEEKIKSVDYDIWKCSSCGNHMIEEYEGDVFASDCPKCKYKTYQLTKSVTIRSATTSSSGLAKDYYNCNHCKHSEVKDRIIPQIQKSSSGGSSGSRSSSGGGGGSFGGGSSGGGGGGRSY